MNTRSFIGNGILWATAIVASAILHAPSLLTGFLLPALAMGALVVIRTTSPDELCRKE